ncbi:hypothetical protein SAMN00790413_04035 [Deinococcus hopiensis KR-140]|uniref:Uncharacterized protein n=1 Tax=Deinococcus hopiensis KR-140 TaxID=695939 RepID=A0A1W1UN23_9DEIO|nr:hypothetical protein SAMN00790413_04035 [Deinococcus hopiensis KR-140]
MGTTGEAKGPPGKEENTVNPYVLNDRAQELQAEAQRRREAKAARAEGRERDRFKLAYLLSFLRQSRLA